MQLDTSVHHSTLRPHKPLKNNGTTVTQVVESVRTPAQGLTETNGTFTDGTRLLTVRSFLRANAIRAADAMDNID
jgi:hypothetical protein